MLFYLQSLAIFIWLAIGSLIGVVYSLFNWGNLNNNGVFGRIMAFGMLPIIRLKVKIDDPIKRDSAQPCIYVANHQSGLDVAICGKVCPPKLLIIGKKELKWMPFFGMMFAAGGNVFIDRKNRSSAVSDLKEVIRALRDRGASIFIFAEGTRNHNGRKLLKFKKGAFYMAIEAQVPIVPFVVPPLDLFFDRKGKRFIPATITVKTLDPIPTKGMKISQVEELAARTQELMQNAIDKMK